MKGVLSLLEEHCCIHGSREKRAPFEGCYKQIIFVFIGQGSQSLSIGVDRLTVVLPWHARAAGDVFRDNGLGPYVALTLYNILKQLTVSPVSCLPSLHYQLNFFAFSGTVCLLAALLLPPSFLTMDNLHTFLLSTSLWTRSDEAITLRATVHHVLLMPPLE